MQRKKVYEEIAARLEQWIASSRKPGETLPPERQLVEMFGAGRSSIRDALHELQSRGVVETRHGVGTIVRDRQASRRLTDMHALQRARLADLIDFRKMIEPPLAARAALRASDAELAALSQTVREQARRVKRGASTTDCDRAFHELIAKAAHNQAVLDVLDAIMAILEPTRELHFQSAERATRSLDGHREILDALERRDPDASERAMRRHLETVETLINAPARRATKQLKEEK